MERLWKTIVELNVTLWTLSTTTSKTKGEEIVEYAKKYLGYDYVLGGSTPKLGFDCSGFTSYVYKQFGYTLSRASTAQAKNGKEVSRGGFEVLGGL